MNKKNQPPLLDKNKQFSIGAIKMYIKSDMAFFICWLFTIAILSLCLFYILFFPLILVSHEVDGIISFSPVLIFCSVSIILGKQADKTKGNKKIYRWIAMAIIVILVILNFYLCFLRIGIRFDLTSEFDGYVKEKYRSNNHAAFSFVLQNEDGKTMKLEGVDYYLYETAKVGDRVKKKEWSKYAWLNNQKIPYCQYNFNRSIFKYISDPEDEK